MQKHLIIPECVSCTVRCKSVFSVLQHSDLEELDGLKEATHCRKGQTIFYERSQPRGVFVVHTGKVKVFKLGSNGREQIVRLARPGDVLGYRSLLCNERYTASAATLEESVICFIPRTSLFNLLDRHAPLSMNLMRLLSKDLAMAENKVVGLVSKPVRDRLAEALLILREVYGTAEDGKTLNVTMTREEIANLTGTTTETAIRLLSEFRDDGIIGIDKKKILILDLDKLVHESQLND